MKLAKQAQPVLVCLNALMAHFGKGYCFPGQLEICRRLAEWYGAGISRRQLNRVLREMESGFLIRRTRRIRRHPRRGMEFRSTLYEITGRGWRQLRAWGSITKERLADMVNRVKVRAVTKQKPESVTRTRSGFESLASVLSGVKPGVG